MEFYHYFPSVTFVVLTGDQFVQDSLSLLEVSFIIVVSLTGFRIFNTIYLPGNFDIVKRKLNKTGGDIISCGADNITCEPLLI